ncbi:PREDICTED: uncharacterized protein LOC105153410 [Acromyrmex echinatior]|uniref:Uncharacterized protein n=1 Tax=Acromyrmex echinatior TaxID=103372 RepID=F4X6U9_ACREC|nr:PREDICTED: uncharacterized protein LOC105153410 [Acromyrmex echinatior]EGI57881.1 hypothetical protein G5I_14068 [Acromyrmex echinatior]
MPGIASATGLLSARIQPIRRPKPKSVELSGCTRAAPFALRPFAGLFNPYPYGCSVLCNHPADCEAKEVVRRAKDTWATEGKALLLPEEMEMIRASLLAVGAGGGGGETAAGNVGSGDGYNTEMTASAVPEELFRKYTETDSRPLTPAPTLASGPTALTGRAAQEDLPATCNPRERTTLVLDLRTSSQNQQENETFSWHALTLELPPTPRKSEIFICKPTSRSQHSLAIPVPPPSSLSSPIAEKCETSSSRNVEEEVDSDNEQQPTITRRRGKRLRKRKCRRGSTYGQQTEVRDPLEPTVTQVSQIGNGSRRSSLHVNVGEVDGSTSPKKRTSVQATSHTMSSSFLEPDILKHLCRELDRDKVEAEFSIKRRIALEEALRVKGDAYTLRGSRQTSISPSAENAPRIFSRQAARFELLDSQSLCGLTSLQYLSKHAYVTSGRKLIFGRIFNKFNEEALHSARRISPSDIEEALGEMVGKALTDEQRSYIKSVIGDVTQPLGFREWCGLCAAVERLLCSLPSRESDPPTWLERTDFETLERRLKSARSVDFTLALLLKEIRDR